MAPKTYRKRNYKKKTPVSKAVKAYVARTIDSKIEDKFITMPLSAMGTISTTWNEQFPAIAVGTSADSNRIGRKISIKDIEIRGIIRPSDLYNVVRLVLSVSSSASPMVANGVGIDNPLIKQSPIWKTLKRVLFDKYIVLNENFMEGTAYVPRLVPFTYKKTFKTPIVVTYGDDTTTSFDKILVLSMVSDSIITSHPVFTNGYIVMKYEDA